MASEQPDLKRHLGKLGRGTFVYGMGQILTNIISLLLLPLFTSYLSTTDYGITAILGIVNFIAVSVFSLGLGTSIGPCYYEAKEPRDRSTTIWTALFLLVGSVLALDALSFLFGRQISRLAFKSEGNSYLVQISILTTSATILNLPLKYYMQFRERARQFVLLTALSTLAIIGLNVIMVIALRRGVRGWVEGQFIGQCLQLLLFFVISMRGSRPGFSSKVIKNLLRLGIPYMPSFIFLFVLGQSNKYILQWFGDLHEVGIYTVGFTLGNIMSLPVTAFQTAWYPFFMSFKDKKEEASSLFGKIATYYVLGFGALSLLFFLFAGPVVTVMTQAPFHGAYRVVGLSAAAQLLMGFFYILLPGAYFAKEIRTITVVQAIAAALAIGPTIFAISRLGITGAALSLPAGYFLMNTVMFLANKRKGYLRVRYEWGRIGKFSIVYIIFAAFSLSSGRLGAIGQVFVTGVGALLLPVTIYAILTKSERAILSQFVKKSTAIARRGMRFAGKVTLDFMPIRIVRVVLGAFFPWASAVIENCRMEYVKSTLAHCGKEVVLYPGVVIVGPGHTRIGDHTHIGDRSYLRGGGEIEIGEWCQIANNTIIVTENHNIDGGRYFGNVTTAKVVIGNNVWIGSNAIILPGVRYRR